MNYTSLTFGTFSFKSSIRIKQLILSNDVAAVPPCSVNIIFIPDPTIPQSDQIPGGNDYMNVTLGIIDQSPCVIDTDIVCSGIDVSGNNPIVVVGWEQT